MSESSQDNNPLAQEMAAQMQLGVFGTVGKLARQLRAIQRIAPQLKEGGLVRKLTVDRSIRRRAVGSGRRTSEHRGVWRASLFGRGPLA